MNAFKTIRKLPLFPFLPFGPILVAAGTIFLEVLTLKKLRNLAREVHAMSRDERVPIT